MVSPYFDDINKNDVHATLLWLFLNFAILTKPTIYAANYFTTASWQRIVGIYNNHTEPSIYLPAT